MSLEEGTLSEMSQDERQFRNSESEEDDLIEDILNRKVP